MIRRVEYSKSIEKYFIVTLSLLFLVLTFFVLESILTTIIYAFILSYFLFPLYRFYFSKFENKQLSAMLTLLTITIGLFFPITLLLYFIILNLVKLTLEYQSFLDNPEMLNGHLQYLFSNIFGTNFFSDFDLTSLYLGVVEYVLSLSSNFFSSIPKVLFFFFILLFISYYTLTYNKRLLKGINGYLPLDLKKQDVILSSLSKNIKVLFRGYFLTGLVQTLIAFIGYFALGVPNLLLLTFLTFLTALIPYIGTPLVWIPLAFYLMLVGQEVAGILLLLYGAFVITTVDNILRPILMSDKDTISPPLVFVGFIGGMVAFGIEGLILGPLVIAVTIVLLKFLAQEYSDSNSK